MRNDFLTIPDAPKYEVNSQLIVRNKKTKRVLKVSDEITPRISIKVADKNITRTPKRFRAEAKAAVDNDKFFPVPSLQNRYEITKKGFLRNAKSKLPVKLGNGNTYHLWDGEKNVSLSVKTLLAEVFGTKPTRVPVVLSKGFRQLYFETISAAARFLSEKYFYSVSRARTFLSNRRKFIFEWQVEYLDEMPTGYLRAVNHHLD